MKPKPRNKLNRADAARARQAGQARKVEAEEIWGTAWVYIKTVVDTLREPFLILDSNLRVVSANQTFYNFFGTDAKSTEKKLVYHLGNGQWDIVKLRILLEDILPKNSFFEDFKVEHYFPSVGRKILLLNARRIYTASYAQPIMLVAMEDITREKLLEEQLKVYAQRLNADLGRKNRVLEHRVLELEKINKVMAAWESKMDKLKIEIVKLKNRVKK